MFAVTVEAGQCMSTPDVCKTPAPPGPPVPVPYPNIAMPQMGYQLTQKVLIVGKPALTKASQIPNSSGDEPGVAGGVVSGKVMAEMKFTAGSMTVKFEGNAAVRLNDPTQHNGGNAVGAVLVPSQNVVMVMS
ncbi:DUF4150 domain-containing protein [Paraburkholderia sp. J11-2]|uniref:DUF4150 domain-containing protein n=1 Tax=Paraburkholderia sp. J11-2 TaxID=2805431 RepID=UPI002AB61FFC|nr:DUF4150 domain-containing protein [Paraburkholderia sp. J11-2]